MPTLERTVIVALFTSALLGGCKKDIDQLDKGAVEDGKTVAGVLLDRAQQEQKAGEDQQRTIEREIREVQDLIAAGDLDKAEAKLSNVYWKPDPARSMISDSTKELMRQYDERRQALAKIIERKRAEKSGR
jgi:hypothetical protein